MEKNIKIGRMVLGSYGTNCYFVYSEEEKQAIVIDPAKQGEQIFEKLKEMGFQVLAIFLTHGHFDHIQGAKALKECAKVKIYALLEEKTLCEDAKMNVSSYMGTDYTLTPDVTLKDGEVLNLGGMECKVLATPGHTLGSCCYYFEQAGFCVCGDTIFEESVGRTDFPTGNSRQLVTSIKEKIFTLPEEVILYPGHGNSTTVEHEKKCNPYVD